MHGSLHLWARLKWLVDIAHLAHKRGRDRLAEDLDTAEHCGLGVPVRIALRLACETLSSPLPATLPPSDAAETALVARMRQAIAAPDMNPEGGRYRLAIRPMSWHLAPDTTARMGVVRFEIWRRLRLGMAAMGLSS